MKFNIVPFDAAVHKDGLMKLWREELSINDKRRFEWLYRQNPAGPPVTFIAIDAKNQDIIGCASVFPREISVFGNIEKIGIAADFAVDKKYRVFGPAIPLQKAIIAYLNSGPFVLNFGYPNKAGAGIFPRLGYQNIGSSQSWTRILRVNSKLNAKIHNACLSSILSFPVNTILKLIDVIKWNPGRDFVLKRIREFDDSFDTLWEEFIKEQRLITGVRKKDYLQWRANEPGKKLITFGLYKQNSNAMMGYISYTLKGQTVLVEDVFCLLQENLLKILFLSFIKEMRQKGHEIISMSYFGNEKLPGILKEIHFIQRPQKRNCVIYIPEKNVKMASQALFQTKTNWFLSDNEMDL